MGKYRHWRNFPAPRHAGSKMNYVCFTCRRSVKQERERELVKCPECARPMVNMGRYFRVPPRHADNQWRKVALLVDAGVPFHSNYVPLLMGNAMKTLAQAKQAVGRWRSQASK
jgi:DNA-directed RNA polymerase subunit RPC12/RpoP